MEEYDSNKEFCKLTKSIPLRLFKVNCKNVNYNEQLNISYRNRIIRNLSILITLNLILIYLLIINKRTNILKSRINIGAFFMICIILSSYYSIMSYLDEGEKGPYGDKGPKGKNGEKGPIGIIGPTGFTGRAGNVGENSNSGPPGPPGIIGDKGDPGIKGLRGERGEKGEKGYKGNQGEKGITGKPGVNGSKGPKGNNGKDNTIIENPVDGDSSKLYPVFTYYSDSQKTTWSQPYTYYDVHNDISSYLKCDLNNSVEYSNRTYNECKSLCTNEIDSKGYKKCVGMYGNLDETDPDGSRGECFICPEKVFTKQKFFDNLNNIPKQSNPPDPMKSWDRFVTGYKLATVRNDEDNDSAHTYLSNFNVTNKF